MLFAGCTRLLFADNTVAHLVGASAGIDRNDTMGGHIHGDIDKGGVRFEMGGMRSGVRGGGSQSFLEGNQV